MGFGGFEFVVGVFATFSYRLGSVATTRVISRWVSGKRLEDPALDPKPPRAGGEGFRVEGGRC